MLCIFTLLWNRAPALYKFETISNKQLSLPFFFALDSSNYHSTSCFYEVDHFNTSGKWKYTLSFCDSLISLKIMSQGSTCCSMWQVFPFCLNNIPLCAYVTFCLTGLTWLLKWMLGWFVWKPISHPILCKGPSGIVRSYSNSMFNFLKSCQMVFLNFFNKKNISCTIFVVMNQFFNWLLK